MPAILKYIFPVSLIFYLLFFSTLCAQMVNFTVKKALKKETNTHFHLNKLSENGPTDTIWFNEPFTQMCPDSGLVYWNNNNGLGYVVNGTADTLSLVSGDKIFITEHGVNFSFPEMEEPTIHPRFIGALIGFIGEENGHQYTQVVGMSDTFFLRLYNYADYSTKEPELNPFANFSFSANSWGGDSLWKPGAPFNLSTPVINETNFNFIPVYDTVTLYQDAFLSITTRPLTYHDDTLAFFVKDRKDVCDTNNKIFWYCKINSLDYTQGLWREINDFFGFNPQNGAFPLLAPMIIPVFELYRDSLDTLPMPISLKKASVKINLFPNPAKDYLNFEYSCTTLSNLLIYTNTGILINNIVLPSTNGIASKQMELENMTNGQYFYVWTNNKQALGGKFEICK